MSVDFRPIIPDPAPTPGRGNYTDLQPFRFWCQKVLPLVYDESLSYYELLCKVVDYLNKTMEDVGVLNEDIGTLYDAFTSLTGWTEDQVEALLTAYSELQDYVNNYFDNLNVQTEINNKLDALVTDGTMSQLVAPFIPDQVAAWLSSHVDPSTGYVVDTTLSIAGAAADAKATGDAIDLISNEVEKNKKSTLSIFDQLSESGKAEILNPYNLFPDPTFKKRLWGAQNGTLSYTEGEICDVCTLTRTDLEHSGYLEAILPIALFENGKTYRIRINDVNQLSNQFIAIRQNMTGNYGDPGNWIIYDTAMTIDESDPSKTVFHYDWAIDSSDFGNYKYVQIMFKIEANPRSYFNPFVGDLDEYTSYLLEWDLPKDYHMEPSQNYFNGESYNNKYYGSSSQQSASGYVSAVPQLLDPGTYLFNIDISGFGTSPIKYFIFSSDDGSQEYISSANATLVKDLTQYLKVYKFTIYNKSYVGLNIGYGNADTKAAHISNFMIVRGSTEEDWPVSYRYNNGDHYEIDEPVQLNSTMLAQTKKIYGKKLAINGDSIAIGAGETSRGFMKAVTGRNNMELLNIAVSGATLVTGTTSGGVDRHWISTSIINMPEDYDYYIFEGGVNDFANSVPLGTLTTGFPEKNAENDNIDPTTVIGAMEYACRDLVTLFQGKKYGFVFPHGIFGYTGSYATWHTQYKPGMIAALNKWGVPYLDLEVEMPPIGLIDDLKAIYTKNGDGWHPNKECIEVFYRDKVESWLETL